MREHAPALIVLIPLSLSLLAPLFARISKEMGRIIMILGLAAATYFSFVVLFQVLETGNWHYYFGNWQPPWGIEYVLDTLNSAIALMISFIATVVAVYSKEFL
jgi:multicomponent Na+:H+ antiporter subunit D